MSKTKRKVLAYRIALKIVKELGWKEFYAYDFYPIILKELKR